MRVRVARITPRQALLLLRIQIDALVCARKARLGAMRRALAPSRPCSSRAGALLDGTHTIAEVCRRYFFVVRACVAICGVRYALDPTQPVPVIARHAFLSTIRGALGICSLSAISACAFVLSALAILVVVWRLSLASSAWARRRPCLARVITLAEKVAAGT